MNIELKEQIDKYKNWEPSDDELTSLFDRINSLNLTQNEKDEALTYLESVCNKAKIHREQDAAESVRRVHNHEKIDNLSTWIILSILVVCPLVSIAIGIISQKFSLGLLTFVLIFPGLMLLETILVKYLENKYGLWWKGRTPEPKFYIIWVCAIILALLIYVI